MDHFHLPFLLIPPNSDKSTVQKASAFSPVKHSLAIQAATNIDTLRHQDKINTGQQVTH